MAPSCARQGPHRTNNPGRQRGARRGHHLCDHEQPAPEGSSHAHPALDLSTPIAGFNGGMIIDPDEHVLEERTIHDDIVATTMDSSTSTK